MLKRIYPLLSAAVLLSGVQPLYVLNADCAAEPEISAKAAVLISADTGEVIYSLNSGEKLPMASTTKIMTALLCLESGDLSEEFTVDSEAIKVEGSSMGLQEGDIVTKYALSCGMLLPSGNDAANAAAVRIAGSIPAFVELMNDRAQEIGLSHTYFVTPSGLDGEGHGSTAYDMALLAREALRNEDFRSICSQTSIKVSFGAPPYDRWLKNTNKLLGRYEGTYGVKTGFTDEAGRCLVSACERDGKDLICVTLNDRSDWQDHAALYDYGFAVTELRRPELPGLEELDTVGGVKDGLKLKYGEIPELTTAGKITEPEYTLLSAPFVYAPVKEGDEAAQLRISLNGREAVTVPVYAAEDIAAAPVSSPKKSGKLKKIISKLREFIF